MKESESSYDVMASVKELQALVGGHIDKIYHPSLDHLILAVRLPGEGKSFVHFWVGKWLYRSDKGQDAPQQPSDFAMMLRKRIANAKIVDVRQQGFERIAVLTVEKDERYELVLELFAEGNVILVANGAIVQPLTSHTWKHRDIRAKRTFSFPPPIPDTASMGTEELLQLIHGSDTDLVRTIATKLNTGGRYSEEICARAGIDKHTKAREVTEEEGSRILGVMRTFAAEVRESEKAYVILKEGKPEDVVPAKLSMYEDAQNEEFATFSEAVESYMPRVPAKKDEKPRDATLELERLKRKAAQQEAAITSLQDEAREDHILGDFVFANYSEIGRILSLAKEAVADGRDLDDIPGYVAFDRRSSILKVMIKSVQLGLDVKGTVESNARTYYEKAKKARKKLEGVLVALEAARKELEDHSKGEAKAERSSRARHEPSKRFWFERFRWFISSEGALVLGGKDAKSNDLLVKKHLQAGDRYAHADIHGAPSVVVKMKENVTEVTLQEACEFAVATSKAWNAKVGSAAGYWVLPEQVSKTPQSGEHLARGAFVIRGKRNYTGKIDLKLGIGEIEHEGSRKVMCGPEGAVRKHSRRYVIVRPGERDRNAIARQLSDAFRVPIEEIQSILPPGDVEVVEQVDLVIS